ncbi:hypothetical protein [Domibacillus epiphyticus]|uniref:Peptidase M23 domain-containing protein n=1 Tax=Domibacillus epiphyticus TaxID=1714355 RepID=A0A1V2A9E4_9BACI|nr:hypothetical protein [Domibacillus epiphyticus]OMP67550.1 hypothetical protein BTO28_06285 [Domibacillus epiphyticus]
MKGKIAAAALLYFFVYVNRDQPAVIQVFTGDFTFARTAYIYEYHLGTFLPSIQRNYDEATPANVSHGVKAEREGMVVRINRDDHSIMLQHRDGNETEIKGVYVDDFRLFEKIEAGATIGQPAEEYVYIWIRKDGQVISKKRMGTEDVD